MGKPICMLEISCIRASLITTLYWSDVLVFQGLPERPLSFRPVRLVISGVGLYLLSRVLDLVSNSVHKTVSPCE